MEQKVGKFNHWLLFIFIFFILCIISFTFLLLALGSWPYIYYTVLRWIIFISSAVGTLVGMTFILVKGKNMKFAVPFGPFLSIGAITYIFFGQIIIYWYFNVLI